MQSITNAAGMQLSYISKYHAGNLGIPLYILSQLNIYNFFIELNTSLTLLQLEFPSPKVY